MLGCPLVSHRQMNRGEVSEAELKERQARAMADPEVQSILSDPIMRQVGPQQWLGCCPMFALVLKRREPMWQTPPCIRWHRVCCLGAMHQ